MYLPDKLAANILDSLCMLEDAAALLESDAKRIKWYEIATYWEEEVNKAEALKEQFENLAIQQGVEPISEVT